MTLDTRFRINDPHATGWQCFEFARTLIGSTDSTVWAHDDTSSNWLNPSYRNEAGQGLPALLYVYYRDDGSLLREYDDEGERPPANVEISFDTSYGYRDEYGNHCGDIHAIYVSVLGIWCEGNGWEYHWMKEATGEWFSDWREAKSHLGSAGTRPWVPKKDTMVMGDQNCMSCLHLASQHDDTADAFCTAKVQKTARNGISSQRLCPCRGLHV